MKECPACRRIFSDGYGFCLADGTVLEALDEPTLVGKSGFSVPVGAANAEWNTPTIFGGSIEVPSASATANGEPRRPRRFGLAAAGVGGLLLGASAVLTVIVAVNGGLPLVENLGTNAAANRPSFGGASSSAAAAANLAPEEAKPVVPPAKKRAAPGGRVVALNAVVRLAPSMEAWPIGVVEYGTPLKIGRRAGPNSPWYRVATPGGISGWMHGNTFEFVE